jgi:hypothetical protein
MRDSAIERWCHPKRILVATNLMEGPAVMLEAVQQAKQSHAEILLVHVMRLIGSLINHEHSSHTEVSDGSNSRISGQ